MLFQCLTIHQLSQREADDEKEERVGWLSGDYCKVIDTHQNYSTLSFSATVHRGA